MNSHRDRHACREQDRQINKMSNSVTIGSEIIGKEEENSFSTYQVGSENNRGGICKIGLNSGGNENAQFESELHFLVTLKLVSECVECSDEHSETDSLPGAFEFPTEEFEVIRKTTEGSSVDVAVPKFLEDFDTTCEMDEGLKVKESSVDLEYGSKAFDLYCDGTTCDLPVTCDLSSLSNEVSKNEIVNSLGCDIPAVAMGELTFSSKSSLEKCLSLNVACNPEETFPQALSNNLQFIQSNPSNTIVTCDTTEQNICLGDDADISVVPPDCDTNFHPSPTERKQLFVAENLSESKILSFPAREDNVKNSFLHPDCNTQAHPSLAEEKFPFIAGSMYRSKILNCSAFESNYGQEFSKPSVAAVAKKTLDCELEVYNTAAVGEGIGHDFQTSDTPSDVDNTSAACGDSLECHAPTNSSHADVSDSLDVSEDDRQSHAKPSLLREATMVCRNRVSAVKELLGDRKCSDSRDTCKKAADRCIAPRRGDNCPVIEPVSRRTPNVSNGRDRDNSWLEAYQVVFDDFMIFVLCLLKICLWLSLGMLVFLDAV